MSNIIKKIREDMKGVTHCFKDVSLKKKGDFYYLQFTTPSFSVPTSAGDLEMGEFKLQMRFNDFAYVSAIRGRSVNFKGQYVHPNLEASRNSYKYVCVGDFRTPISNLVNQGDFISAFYLVWDIISYCDRGNKQEGYRPLSQCIQYSKRAKELNYGLPPTN